MDLVFGHYHTVTLCVHVLSFIAAHAYRHSYLFSAISTLPPPLSLSCPVPAATSSGALSTEGILLIIVCLALAAVVGLVVFMFLRLRKLQVDPAAYENLQGRCESAAGHREASIDYLNAPH